MNVGNLVLSRMELFIGQTPQTEDSIIYGSKGYCSSTILEDIFDFKL
jgi:hypothetical protein